MCTTTLEESYGLTWSLFVNASTAARLLLGLDLQYLRREESVYVISDTEPGI